MPPAVAGLDGAHDASSPFSHPGWRESVFRGPHASTAGVASGYVRGRSPLRAAAAGQLSLFES